MVINYAKEGELDILTLFRKGLKLHPSDALIDTLSDN